MRPSEPRACVCVCVCVFVGVQFVHGKGPTVTEKTMCVCVCVCVCVYSCVGMNKWEEEQKEKGYSGDWKPFRRCLLLNLSLLSLSLSELAN